MSFCKYCGELIDWIRTQGGRPVPVECRPVVVMPGQGTEEFITDEGEWIKGKRTPAGPVGGNIVANIPHRRHCTGLREKGRRKS